MDEFKRYLFSKKIVTKKMPYYLNWITKFHEFCDIKYETPITSENIDRFFHHISHSISYRALDKLKPN
jgi:hypothetical protein